jgi:F-type H+-transporting ATPase subunit b
MSIDWITVAAQIANFLVLVWLLKRFLYRPILDGIDAREAEITERMGEAARLKETAAATREDYTEKLHTLQVEQAVMAETIRKEAEHKRDAMLAEAQSRMAQEVAAWHADRDKQAQQYKAGLDRAAAGALLAVTRKALDDLADETLEARMAAHLLAQISPDDKDLMQAAGQAGKATVLSRDLLPHEVKDAISAKLEKVFGSLGIEFKVDEEQSPGMILRIGGAQLSWTVDSYIEGLESAMDAQLGKGATRAR